MVIETKYDIKDRVWIILNNQAREVTILGILVNTNTISNSITYRVSNGSGDTINVSETYVFDTKVDLIESL